MNRLLLITRISVLRVFSNPLFVIKIENGTAIKISGQAKNSFMYDCIEIAKRNNIKYGFIYAKNSIYGNPVLNASYEISKDMLQQLRNTWSFHS